MKRKRGNKRSLTRRVAKVPRAFSLQFSTDCRGTRAVCWHSRDNALFFRFGHFPGVEQLKTANDYKSDQSNDEESQQHQGDAF
jgi:hypothetical protein